MTGPERLEDEIVRHREHADPAVARIETSCGGSRAPAACRAASGSAGCRAMRVVSGASVQHTGSGRNTIRYGRPRRGRGGGGARRAPCPRRWCPWEAARLDHRSRRNTPNAPEMISRALTASAPRGRRGRRAGTRPPGTREPGSREPHVGDAPASTLQPLTMRMMPPAATVVGSSRNGRMARSARSARAASPRRSRRTADSARR